MGEYPSQSNSMAWLLRFSEASDSYIASKCIGIILCITCSPSKGVDVLTGVIIDAASLLSLLTAAFFDGFLNVCPHTNIPYVNLLMNTASIIHFINFGFGPQFRITAFFNVNRYLFPLVIWLCRCVFQDNFWSRVTPRYLAVVLNSTGWLLTPVSYTHLTLPTIYSV